MVSSPWNVCHSYLLSVFQLAGGSVLPPNRSTLVQVISLISFCCKSQRYPDVCDFEWAFISCVCSTGHPPPSGHYLIPGRFYPLRCVCRIFVCVLWKVRFSWCLPVNSGFLPSGTVCCLIGRSDIGHLCFLAPSVPTQKHPLFDHFALFDWHICSKCITVKGGGEIR